MECKIIKKLASGMVGTSYLAKYGKEKVIMKISHINSDELQNPISNLNASIKFNDFAKNYPQHFMILLEYGIINDCKYKHEYPFSIKHWPKKIHDEFIKLHDSDICIRQIYSPVLDGTIASWYRELNTKLEKPNYDVWKDKPAIYSYFIQFYYIYWLMKSNGILHGDAHMSNTMYKLTDKKTININLGKTTYRVPTYGKQIYLIDYDGIYINRFNDKSKDRLIKDITSNPHVYLAEMFLSSCTQPWWGDNKIKNIKIPPVKTILNKMKKSPQISYLIKMLPDIKEPKTLGPCALCLNILFEPESHFKMMGFDINIQPWKRYLEITKTKQQVNKLDIAYCIKNLTNHQKVIKRLFSTL